MELVGGITRRQCGAPGRSAGDRSCLHDTAGRTWRGRLWFIPRMRSPDNAICFSISVAAEVIAAISNETRYAEPNRKAHRSASRSTRRSCVTRQKRSGTGCTRDTCTARRKNGCDRGCGRASRLACDPAVKENGNGGSKQTALQARQANGAQERAGPPLVQIQGLTKRFDGVAAVDDVSLDIRRNELFAISSTGAAGSK